MQQTEALTLSVNLNGRTYFTRMHLTILPGNKTAGTAYAYYAKQKAGYVRFIWNKGVFKTPYIVAHNAFSPEDARRFALKALEAAAAAVVLNQRSETPEPLQQSVLALETVSQQLLAAHVRRPNIAVIRGKPVLRRASIINAEKLSAPELEALQAQVDIWNNLAGFWRTQHGERLDPVAFDQLCRSLREAPKAPVERPHEILV